MNVKRLTVLLASVGVVVFALPMTAFAAHCENVSKQPEAGNHITVVIDVSGLQEVVTVEGQGGWAEVWLDFDGDGVGDLMVESDIMIGKNHAYINPDGTFRTDVEPWVNPGAIQKALSEHATKTHGMIVGLEG